MGSTQLGLVALHIPPLGHVQTHRKDLEVRVIIWQRLSKPLVAENPGLPQNSTLLASVNRLPLLQRSQKAFHLVSVLKVLLSVFYGQQNQDTVRSWSPTTEWEWVGG